VPGVDADGLAGDGPGQVRGQVDDRPGDLVGGREVAERGLGGDLLVLLVGVDPAPAGQVLEVGGDLVAPDVAGVDAVDPDAVAAQLDGEDLGDGGQGGLGGGVGAEAGLGPHGRHRVDHHDAPVALLDHRRRRGLGELQGAEEVDLHRPPPPVEVGVEEPPVVAIVEGVVDEHVEAPEAVDDLVDRRAARRRVGDVQAQAEGGGPRRRQLVGERADPGLVPSGHDHRRPLPAQRPGHRAPQARPGPRHERHLAVEQSHVRPLRPGGATGAATGPDGPSG